MPVAAQTEAHSIRRERVSLGLQAGTLITILSAVGVFIMQSTEVKARATRNENDLTELRMVVASLATTTATIVGATEERRASGIRELDDIKIRLNRLEAMEDKKRTP